MEEETCRGSKNWEEEIYWTHFQYTHFTQFLLSGFDQRLAIPENFSRNLRNGLPEIVTLKGPSGQTWKVGVTVNYDTIFFDHGWKEFVKDHLLQEKDLLLFRYNGYSNFDVTMFDGHSLCEKAASYFVRKCGHTEHDSGRQTTRKSGESSSGISLDSPLEDVVGCQTTRNPFDSPPPGFTLASPKKQVGSCWTTGKTSRSPSRVIPASAQERIGSCQKTRKTCESSSGHIIGSLWEDVEGTAPEKSVHKKREIVLGQSALSRSPTKLTQREIKFVKPVDTRPSVANEGHATYDVEIEIKPDVQYIGKNMVHNSPYMSSKRPVTKEETQDALRLAQAASTRDGLIVVMKPTHITKLFKIGMPARWIKKHLTNLKDQDVILRGKENVWQGRFVYRKDRYSVELKWKNFVVDNKLQVFDVCVFEPGSPVNDNPVLDVNIFRVAR